MRFLRRGLSGLFLLAVTLGLMAFAVRTVSDAVQTRLADQPPQRPARERVFTVNVQTMEPRDVTPVLTAFGELRSRRTLDVRAKTAGTVTFLNPAFVDGGQVSKGDLLLRVDPADAQAALDVSLADVAEAEAELRDATRALALAADDLASAEEQARLREAALTRQRSLQERGFGTDALVEEAELSAASARQSVVSRRQSLATAESRVDQARTAVERAKIALAESERNLADTELFAEFTGILSDVAIVEGGLVSNNEQLAQLIAPDELEVSFRVSTSQYSRLLGPNGRILPAPVTVSLDTAGSGLSATGRITRESGAVGEGVTGRLLFAGLDRSTGFLPGDFVTVAVTEPELKSVVVLPATAVDSASTVLVVGPEDRLQVAPVALLRRQGDDVIVSAPDLAGKQVVSERTPLLGAGIKVKAAAPRGEAQAAAAPAAPELIELSADRRAALIAFVEQNKFMPDDAKKRVLAQLGEDKVPAAMVERIESRMGG